LVEALQALGVGAEQTQIKTQMPPIQEVAAALTMVLAGKAEILGMTALIDNPLEV
jgi:hypothetical protein